MIHTQNFLWLQVCRIIIFSSFHSASKILTDSKRLFLTFTLLLLIPAAVLAQEITWTGGGDGVSWSNPANWNENRVPGQEDDVIINLDGTYTIEKSGNITINSLVFEAESGEQTFRNINGDITLQSESSLGPSVTFIMQAGNIRGDGKLINNGTIQANSSSWSGINNSTLINNGLLQQVSGILYVSNSAMIENNGSIHITADINITNSGALGTIINNGTLTKTGGTGISNITVPIDSRPDSRIESQTGTLELRQNSSYHNTTFAATSENAMLRLMGGIHTLRGLIDGEPIGSIVVNAPLEAHESGATLNFGGSGLRWISSYFQGGNTLTNAGLITMAASSWTGVNGSTLINDGVMIHQTGIFYTANSGVLDNKGTYRFASDVNITTTGALGTFINQNIIEKTGGEEISNISASVDARPGSRVESQSGSIYINQHSTWHNSEFAATTEQSSIQLNSGTHTLRGTISGEPVGQVRINAPLEADESGASVDFGGTGLLWISNYFQGGNTLTNEGTIIMNASSWTGVNASTLVNNGEMLHRGGIFYLTNSAVLTNQQLYRFESDQNITTSGSLSTFINHGVIEKTVGEETSNITASIDSRPESRIESKTGSIWISQNSIYQDMTITAAENAEVRFQGGTHTFGGTVEGAPEGQIVINTSIQADEELNATVSFTENGLTWISNYLIEGGELTNTGLILLDASSWTGLNNSQMINEGTVRHLDGIFYLSNGAEFINNEQYVVLGDESIRRSGSDGSFVNNASFIKDSGGAFIISTIYRNSNSGTVDLKSGELQLQYDTFFETPTVRVGSDSELNLQSGTHTFSGTFSPVNEGVITLNSNFRADPGGATINVPGSGLNWTAGNLIEGNLSNTGTMRIYGNGSSGINAAILQNSGNIILENGAFRLLSSGELKNISEFIVEGDFTFVSTAQAPGLFTNMGLFHKKGGNGVSTINAEFVNSETAEMRFEAGDVRFTSLLDHMENARITGTGRFDIAQAEFINKGVTRPGLPEGILSYVGDYEPNDTTAVLDVLLYLTDDESPMPANSMLSVKETEYRIGFRRLGGAATLAGELAINTAPDFVPDAGTEFEIIRAERGISGGFSSFSGIVDVSNQRSYYPQIRDTSLILITSGEIPSLSGPVAAEPTSIQAGEQQMITFTGTGFPPDLSVELTCRECIQPEMFGTITGRVGSISPDTAVVWFDVSNPLITGTYDAVLTDPRGVQASLTIQINQGPPSLTVLSFDPVIDIQTSDPGKLIIQADRIMDQDLSIPVTISGSARIYEDYVSDFSGSRALIQSGSDRFVMNVFPTSNSESDGPRTVSLSISSSDDYTLESSFSTVTIPLRPQKADFDIYALSPSYGGTGGTVTSEIVGTGISPNATVRLVNGGSEISGTNINVRENGSALTATFQLSEAELGFWSVILTNEGGESKEINQGFSVVNRVRHSVVADIIAPPRVARGRNNLYKLSFRNTGNNDVLGIPGLVGLPAEATWEIVNRTSGDTDLSFDDFVTTQLSDNNRKSLRFWPMRIPPGATVNLDVQIAMPNTGLIRFRPVWFGS